MARGKVRKNNPLFILLLRFAVAAVIVACVVSVISAQSSIAETQKQIEILDEKIEILKDQNRDYSDIVQSNDISRYMEKQAMENGSYSYAYPDERRYYDVSRDH